MRSRIIGILLSTVSLAALAAVAMPSAEGASKPAPVTAVDWPAYHGSHFRYGVATSMPAVRGTPKLVKKLRLDGDVYASPILVDRITVVVTENDTVYGFGSRDKLLWTKHLGSPSPAGERPCGNIDPLGITGTPVYGAKYGVVYVAAELGGPPRHRLYAIDLRTGAVRWSRTLDLAGVDAKAMQERGALTVAGGRVWVPFGGLAGDCGAYKGRLIGYPLNGSGTPAEYTVPTAREAGIWTPPGPTVDWWGHLEVAVGNGASGVGGRYDHSDSVLKIGSTTGKLMSSFSPSTWPTDNDADLDLGSMGPTLVGHERWIFTAGKSGYAYVLHRYDLGGIGAQVSKTRICQAFGGTAMMGDTVYVPCVDGLRAVHIDSSGHMHVLWHAYSRVTGSPVIGGGRIWSLDPNGGRLYALNPSTGKVRSSVAVGTTTRFATPAVYRKWLLVPTYAGMSVVSTS